MQFLISKTDLIILTAWYRMDIAFSWHSRCQRSCPGFQILPVLWPVLIYVHLTQI